MSKLEKIIIKAEETLDYDNKDKLDKFVFKYGKWFIALIPLVFFNTLHFEDVHKFHIAIPIVFSITYLFCLFFCFVDVYRFFKKKQCENSIKIDPTTNHIKEKDPKDYTQCESSTEWLSERSYCVKCTCTTTHNEFMSDICNTCGSFRTQVRFGRSYRKIFYEGKWQYQVKYSEGKEEIIEEWYKFKKQ